MKKWYESKTVWAQVVGILATGLTMAGYDIIDADAQLALVNGIWAAVNVVLRFRTETAIRR